MSLLRFAILAAEALPIILEADRALSEYINEDDQNKRDNNQRNNRQNWR